MFFEPDGVSSPIQTISGHQTLVDSCNACRCRQSVLTFAFVCALLQIIKMGHLAQVEHQFLNMLGCLPLPFHD
jgi:hypothetical protein